jgi:Tfp pilus assembly protein FimT
MDVRKRRTINKRGEGGFTLIQLVAALGVGLTLSAMAVPYVRSTTTAYKLRASTSEITGAIQGTRYRAIYSGYPCRITLTSSTASYQVTKKASTDASFVNVDGAIPIESGTTLDHATVVLTFSPGGSVTVTDGSTALANGTFTISYAGKQMAITVSPYGSVTSAAQ